ncbi:DUF5689 domain-containing protein [Mucilaginibacter segetis]|uniref:DUF5689 domain-containing protein n=1 Tax=Mucilaginibacter segetis TaxID=2793071 RepID=A0A934PTF3_9SPHI|nr:DUF5689 domain-containing protein [Mucilaginibacter segetis]MBK0378740.1 hypothetical protein [Mucilaginibacter segetis]
MKRKIFYIVLCFSALFMSACQKHDFAAGELSPIIAVSDLRDLYKGNDVTLTTDNMLGATEIVGIVISNPDSGNVPKDMVILQNIRRQLTRGIAIPLGAAAANYTSGDSLVVTVNGAILKKVNGTLQLTGITEANIQKISSGNSVTVQSVSSYSIKSNPDAYENTLVQVKTATVSPAPVDGDTYAGDKYLVNGADSVIMHTEETANYATEQLPASATVTGILFVGQDESGNASLQIWPRYSTDITDKTAPIDPNGPKLGVGPIIITGYANDTKGADGNYEYFQFMATKTIDFSKTPVAVVTCTNAGSAAPDAGDAPSGGWAEGGGRTYKFNITEGIVHKGDIFYVGGSNKRIDGPNSTDISSANWVRSIPYTTTDGDGFGSKSSGLLPNSGNAGGIAVFDGINVTETSVPVDAVFYGGTSTKTIYNETDNKGYRIPDNDHYHPIDPATSAAQPFVYQGTNTYVIPHSTPADAGIFVKLGGKFDSATKKWITPRSYVHYTLSLSSELSEIETGADVTVIQ